MMSVSLQIISAVMEGSEEGRQRKKVEGGESKPEPIAVLQVLPCLVPVSTPPPTTNIIIQFLHDPVLFLDFLNAFQVRLYANACQYNTTLDYLPPSQNITKFGQYYEIFLFHLHIGYLTHSSAYFSFRHNVTMAMAPAITEP